MGFNIKSLAETASNAPKRSTERSPEQVALWVGMYKDKKTQAWKLKATGKFDIEGTTFYIAIFKRSESTWVGTTKVKLYNEKTREDEYVEVGQAFLNGTDDKTLKVTLEDGSMMSCPIERKTVDSLIFKDDRDEENPLNGTAKVVFEGIVEMKVYGSSFSKAEEEIDNGFASDGYSDDDY